MFDFHCHSLYSDGGSSPEALLSMAEEAGIQSLALTDHDTMLGVAPLMLAANNSSVQIIPGIELSARWKKHDIHIVALNVDTNNLQLMALIERQSESRIVRARIMGERLALIGIEDAYEKACQLAGHIRVTRPHYADLIVNHKLACDRKAAFKRYLARGRPCYVPTPWASVEDIVTVIVGAHGHAVLAHPLKYGLTQTKLQQLIIAFKDAGGEALEVISGEMTEPQIKTMAGLSLRYNLLSSMGSDFHDEKLSRVGLGKQRPLPESLTPVWTLWTSKQGTL